MWLLAMVIVLLTINWVAAVARYQVNVPMWDQWDYFTPLFHGEGVGAVFLYQHGPHRMGLGFVLSSWVMTLSGWDSRIESLCMVGVLVVCAILALGLKYRLTRRITPIDAGIPVVVLSLAQWETVIAVPNVAHSVFPLLLILLSAHSLLIVRPGMRQFSLSLLAVFSIFTGFAVFNAVVLTLMLGRDLLRGCLAKNSKTMAVATAGLLTVAAGWFLFARGYRFDPASEGYVFPHYPLFDYVRFVALMLAHPLGWDVETAGSYLLGSMLLAVCGVIFCREGLNSIALRNGHRVADVFVLLLAGGIGFAIFTAIGRVHLGLTAGMASRYVSLITALWLGVYLWGVSGGRSWVRLPVAAFCGLLTAWPLASLAHRPLTQWIGTIGISENAQKNLSDYASWKIAWVSAYLRTGDAAKADESVGRLLHPSGALDSKLAWLKARNLSFFKPPDRRDAWQPWWREDRCVWLRSAMAGPYGAWMADECVLWVHCRKDGFITIPVLEKPDVDPEARLEITHRQMVGGEAIAFLNGSISLPVSAGEQLITFKHVDTLGSAPNSGVSSKPMYAFGRGKITDTSQDIAWKVHGLQPAWTPQYRWRFVEGFHGWEDSARFGWTDAILRLEVSARDQLYLNLTIEKRYAPVASGPVVVRLGDQRLTLPLVDERIRVSLPLVPAMRPQQLILENTAGSASPHEVEAKADRRRLALKLGHLSVSTSPVFPLLTAIE